MPNTTTLIPNKQTNIFLIYLQTALLTLHNYSVPSSASGCSCFLHAVLAVAILHQLIWHTYRQSGQCLLLLRLVHFLSRYPLNSRLEGPQSWSECRVPLRRVEPRSFGHPPLSLVVVPDFFPPGIFPAFPVPCSVGR
jgi:hypothetical protein